MKFAGSLSLVVLVAACARAPQPPTPEQLAYTLTEQQSGTRSLLQAVSIAESPFPSAPAAERPRVVWASGHRATWVRTTDGGTTWQAGAMTGADSTLQFRDVHAVSADTAYLLAAGPGRASRIYKTGDGGAHWQLQFMNTDSAAFFDCFGFWDSRHGIAVSDAVRGRLIVIGTDDGGTTWTDRSAGLPAAMDNEGAFAASGTCLVTRPGGRAWITASAEPGSRIYRTGNYGRTWEMAPVPVTAGQATGVASIAMSDDRRGLAAGGNVGSGTWTGDNVALTTDGGRTWTLGGRPTYRGAVFGLGLVNGLADQSTFVAAGPGGLDLTSDGGRTWTNMNSNAHWAVGFGGFGSGWAVGPGGRITKIQFPARVL